MKVTREPASLYIAHPVISTFQDKREVKAWLESIGIVVSNRNLGWFRKGFVTVSFVTWKEVDDLAVRLSSVEGIVAKRTLRGTSVAELEQVSKEDTFEDYMKRIGVSRQT